MGTEVEQRSEEQYQCWHVAIYGIQSHIQLFLLPKRLTAANTEMTYIKGTSYSAQTGRLEQALEPSSGLLWSTHHFSWTLPHRGIYP